MGAMNRRARHAIAGALVSFASLAAACSGGDDTPPGAQAGASVAPGSSGGTGTLPDGSVDASSDGGEPTGPALCMDLVQQSQEVAEYQLNDKPPVPSGGQLRTGTYVLNELALFAVDTTGGSDPPPPGPTGKLVRSTLVVTGKVMRVIESRGTSAAPLPADVARAGLYRVDGMKLGRAGICPTPDPEVFVPYSTDGNLITLHVADDRIEVYRRLP